MILRLLYGVIFGILNIQRMDVPTVAYYLEGMDAGYGAYVGFMVVDKTHTHPIALSFLTLLKSLAADQDKIPNTRGKANWHLAYTLLKNEELRHYRKHSIKMQKLEEKVRMDAQRTSLFQKVSGKMKVKKTKSKNDEMTERNPKNDDIYEDEIYIKPVETKTTKLDETD